MAETPLPHPTPLPPPRRDPPDWPVIVIIVLIALVAVGTALWAAAT